MHTLANPTPASDDQFGFAVDIDDGKAVVSAVWDDTGAFNAGSAYIFDVAGGDLLQTVNNPAPRGGDQFGYYNDAVGLSGNTLIVGTPFDDFSSRILSTGSAYIFTAPPTAVPLPAGLPLLLGGLGAFALLRNRRRPCA